VQFALKVKTTQGTFKSEGESSQGEGEPDLQCTQSRAERERGRSKAQYAGFGTGTKLRDKICVRGRRNNKVPGGGTPAVVKPGALSPFYQRRGGKPAGFYPIQEAVGGRGALRHMSQNSARAERRVETVLGGEGVLPCRNPKSRYQ